MFRLNRITFHNFRNILDSTIDFNNTKTNNNVGGNIVGIYGPNGTSKSSVGYALAYLSKLSSGICTALFHNFDNDFGIRDVYSSLVYEFDFDVPKDVKKVEVRFEFKKNQNNEVFLSYEKVTFYQNMGTPVFYDINRGQDSINLEITDNQVRKLKELFEADSKVIYSILALSVEKKKSLLLSFPLEAYLSKKRVNDKLDKLCIFSHYLFSNTAFILPDLYGLSIINSLFAGYSLNDEIPLGVMSKDAKGMITLNEQEKARMEEIVNTSNAFVSKLIPDFKVRLAAEAITLSEEKQQKYNVKLFSCKKDGEFNFENESEGIKRLFFIASSIAKGMSNSDYIVFVDEMDEGIFEVLFGSFVETISEYCKCQVIFTSHNLRPLEVLNYHQFVFSTNDENNRFRRLSGIGNTNNLRDVYIRKIIYGDPTIDFGKYIDNIDVAEGLFHASK